MSKLTSTAALDQPTPYTQLERVIRGRIAGIGGPVFETDAPPDRLWELYLAGIPSDSRQEYTCTACRRFVQRFGGLVTVQADGSAAPVLWNAEGAPEFFRASVASLEKVVARARVKGVFLASDPVWGIPRTGEWTHLSGMPARVYDRRARTAEQAMAEHREDFKVLSRGLNDYPKAAVEQALRVLKADALSRSEKTLEVAQWFFHLHETVQGVKGQKRENLIWAAVATAPAGFCRVRSTMISTLLDDIVAGLKFAAISRRWAEKMHPLRYQRPTAPPSAGTIEQAERLVETLGVARSLERRIATLDDVLVTVWSPPAAAPSPRSAGGVFGHLREKLRSAPVITLPEKAITWEKFSRTVLPDALGIDVLVPDQGSFYGLVTAADPEAPAIIQWDGLEGHPRNPVSWYFYSEGSPAAQWGMTAGAWAPVSAVFLSPHQWQEPSRFTHQGMHAFFAVEGCRDAHTPGLALFPEILKAEFHGIRAVIEAYSNRGVLEKEEGNTANGVAFAKGEHPNNLTLRVRAAGGAAVYTLDRWD